jgi:hypothetical protein
MRVEAKRWGDNLLLMPSEPGTLYAQPQVVAPSWRMPSRALTRYRGGAAVGSGARCSLCTLAIWFTRFGERWMGSQRKRIGAGIYVATPQAAAPRHTVVQLWN